MGTPQKLTRCSTLRVGTINNNRLCFQALILREVTWLACLELLASLGTYTHCSCALDLVHECGGGGDGDSVAGIPVPEHVTAATMPPGSAEGGMEDAMVMEGQCTSSLSDSRAMVCTGSEVAATRHC